jgi:hypothetical protein
MRLHRIKGEDRRAGAEAALRGGEPYELIREEFDETLPDDVRQFRGRVHPGLMSGEYLPDFEGDEVEIARVVVVSATGDVISIRARHQGGRILYRIVDEDDGETVYECAPAESERPLTMGELIGLMDRVTAEGNYPYYGSGLTTVWRDYHADNGSDLDELLNFVKVYSEFYPELSRYYADEASEWLANRKAEYGGEEDDQDEEEDDDEV